MSFSFRGVRGDLETGGLFAFPAERRLRFQSGGSRVIAVTPSPLAFLATVLIIFMLVNSRQSPTFLLWLGMGIFLLATCLRMVVTWQQIHTQMQVQGALANSLSLTSASSGGPTEIRVRMGPSLTGLGGPRSRLQALGLQLAVLDRDLTESDYDILRSLDSDNPPGVEGMAHNEIERLPTYKYKRAPYEEVDSKSCSVLGSQQHSNNNTTEKVSGNDGLGKVLEVRTTLECTVCLEMLDDGDKMRILPCLHQFHATCIDKWLSQQATCPVCKHRLVTTLQGNDAADNI